MSAAADRRPGRKPDASRDTAIRDAALVVLADRGFEGMTMDAVAARAKAGKGAVYRRWSSKEHLVHDAIAHMSRTDVDLESMPDTGSLRSDIAAMARPDAAGEQRVRVIAGLTSMMSTDRTGLGAAAFTASIEPWVAANRILLERAVARGEIAASLDLELLCRLIPSMCLYRVAVERLPLDENFTSGVLDRVLLPAVGLAAE